MEQRIVDLTQQKAALGAELPANWDADRKKYLALEKAEVNARRKYRRNVDSAYEPIKEVMSVIRSVDALEAFGENLNGLVAVVQNDPFEQAMQKIKDLQGRVGKVAGAGDIRSKLSKVRRALKGKTPDREKAAAELTATLDVFKSEIVWRKRAATELLPGLNAYNDAIKGTIGVRLQKRLTKDLATTVAACLSHHRDISLSF